MNNKIIGIIVAIVIVALAGFFLVKGMSSPSNEVASGTNSASSQSNASISAEQSSLKTLLADGKNHKCTFTDTSAGATTSGTVYIVSGKMRGDFDVASQGKTERSHMIVDGQTSYVWVDSLNTGFKMKFDAAAQANANASTQAQTVDPNKTMSFNCDNSTANASLFVVPANIQFTDMTSMTVPGAGSGGGAAANANTSTGGSAAQAAAACATLSEPARTQCMASVSAQYPQ